MHNARYAVRVANDLLWRARRAGVEALAGASGGSVWIKKRGSRERHGRPVRLLA